MEVEVEESKSLLDYKKRKKPNLFRNDVVNKNNP